MAVLQPVMVANAFIRRVRWASIFAMCRYITIGRHMSPLQKCPFPYRNMDPHGYLDPQGSAPKRALVFQC